MAETVTCPFCGDDNFDLIGLKAHFLRGWCEPFNETIRPEEERFDRPKFSEARKQANE
jgi:hypothetical protein